jgi:alpha-tubulin suppressor-like RCC1 family protein
MTIYVKDSGSWREIQQPYVKTSGTWRTINTQSVKESGVWVTTFPTIGFAWTWGNGGSGELGNANIGLRSTPVTIFGAGKDWKFVSGGRNAAFAVKIDGTLWVWGNGQFGQLANAREGGNWSTPITTFAGGTNWKEVSSGWITGAIKTDGTLWTWGAQSQGALGNNVSTPANISTPVTTFAGGTNWKEIFCGPTHAVAIKTDGTLWTWGSPASGALGNGRTAASFTPITTFAGGTNWKQVSCGSAFVAAVKTDGTLWTWGYANDGQLGNASISSFVSTPVTTFAGGTNWKQVSCGAQHVAAIKTDGTLWTWGLQIRGALGNGLTLGNAISTPITTFAGGTNWKEVSCSSASDVSTAATKTDGTLWTWGANSFFQFFPPPGSYLLQGQLGNASTSNFVSTPITTFAGGTNWKQVSFGSYNVVALR